MDDLDALRQAGVEFGRRLATIPADQWQAPTPCGDWNVTELVRHVNMGNRMAELLLHGCDGPTSVGPQAQPPDDVPAAETYATTIAAQLAAFAEAGALHRTVHHIAMDMSGDLLLLFRVLDLALHGWDLASALGIDADLDPAMCGWIWNGLEPIAPLLSGSGMFGAPKGDVTHGATLVERLLHATGR